MTKIIPSILLAATILLFSASGFAQDQTASSKVYVVFLNDAKITDYIVTNLEAVDFQGVKSLKGIAVNSPGWLKLSSAVYFPVDKVETVVEFNSLNDYQNSVK